MTALEYMKKQLETHMVNYQRAYARNAPLYELQNIRQKIGYYSLAVMALEDEKKGVCGK